LTDGLLQAETTGHTCTHTLFNFA